MSPQEAFKVGFLLACAEQGMAPEQTHALVKRASGVLGELVEAPGRVVSSLAPHLMNMGLVAGVGLPILAGGGAGWAAAKLTDDDSNIEQAKSDELLAEYQRLTDQARRQVAMKNLQGRPTMGLKRPLGAAA